MMDRQEEIQLLLKECRMSKRYDSTCRVNKVEGLFELIKENIKKYFIIVEIGSFKGVSTSLFALHAKKIIAIDPYNSIDTFGQEELEDINFAEKQFDKVKQKYKNIIHIKKPSYEAYKDIEDNSADLVYIDGDHRPDAVKKDIELYLPKIKKGGFISGHDFYEYIKDAIIEKIGKPDKIYKDLSWIKKI